MCHNCQKVYEACEEIATKNGGEIAFDETVKGFRITCQGGWHTWTTPFQVKIVKYWCEKCTRTERDTRKAYHRAAEAQRQRELFEQQQRMFNCGRDGACSGNNNNNNMWTNAEDDEDGFNRQQQEYN
jgi:hypothetical protein